MTKTTLQEAIKYIKNVTPCDDPWHWSDFYHEEDGKLPVDIHIAAILNAVVSGNLVPTQNYHKMRKTLQWIALGPAYDETAQEAVVSMMKDAQEALEHND